MSITKKINPKMNNLGLAFFKKINWQKAAQYRECVLMKYLGFDSIRNPICKKEVRASYRIKTELDFDDVEYIDLDESKEWKGYVNKKLEKDKGFFKRYVKLCIKRCEECVEYSKKLKKLDFNKLDVKKIIKIFDKYLLTILKVMPFVYTLGFFEELFTKLRDNLEQRNIKGKQILKYLLELSTPKREIFSAKQKRELLELGKEIQKTNFFFKNKDKIKELALEDFPDELRKKIKTHQKKYTWMGILFMTGKPYSINRFFIDLKDILVKDCKKGLDDMIREKKEKENRIIKIITDLNFSKEERFIVNIIREAAFLRTYRIDMVNISNHNALDFLKYVAHKLSLSYEDFLFLIPQEINEGLLNKKDFSEEIKIRKRGWALILHKDILELITGEKYNLIKKELFSKDYSQYNQVEGMVAYGGPGKVIGKAFVAMGSNELKGISGEDILIAPETTVDFEIAMVKVKAIVTDRGGILSHAAIVSRELKKPCIVGTNFATKVFKTGNLIKVDTSKGTVKLLEK